MEAGSMEESFSQKKHTSQRSWEDDLTDRENLMDWRKSAFQAAMDKLQRDHGTSDTVMQTGEAFGRGVFAQKIKEKSADWTIKEWLSEIEKDVLKPLGSEFTFTKVSHDVAATFMNRDPHKNMLADRSIDSLFNLGVIRGLFLSAFPKGELVLGETTTLQQPELLLKIHPSAKDKLERERILEKFTDVKNKDDI